MKINNAIDLDYITQLFDDATVGITVSDPMQEDNPLIYVNQEFLNLTGYSLEECINHNCRFLQGKDTDPSVVKQIRSAIKERSSVHVRIKNYKKSGAGFWSDLTISPIFDTKKELKYFLGVQKDITNEVMEKLADKERIRELEIEISKLKRKA